MVFIYTSVARGNRTPVRKVPAFANCTMDSSNNNNKQTNIVMMTTTTTNDDHMICIRSMPGRMYGVHCTRQSVIHYVLAGRLYTTNNNRHVRCVIVLYAFMGQTRFCFYYYFHFWSNCCCARACCGRHFEVGQCAVCVGSHDLWGRN